MLLALSVLLILAAVLLCADWWLKHEEFDKIPGPKGVFLLENALQFLMDPVQLFCNFRKLAKEYKNIFKLKMGPKKVLIVHNPEDIEILISGTKNLRKGFLYRFLEPWLREGLLISNGRKWQQRRKILTPAFHFNVLRHFSSVLEDNSRRLIEQLSLEVDRPRTNVTQYIAEFTLTSICETAMGTKLDPKTSELGKRYMDAIYTLGQSIVYRSQRFWMYPNWLFPLTVMGRKQKELLQLISSFRDSVIDKRRENNNYESIAVDEDGCGDDVVYGKRRLAMLDLLLNAEKEDIIDAKGIGEEVDTFMFEGHDTTATALQFAFMLLANNQEAQNKIVEECDQIFGASSRAATAIDLGQLKYLECCIKEALRLYPPVAFVMRVTDQHTKLKNYEVPAGVDCAIMIYDLHRRGDQFVEPLEFRPERFLTEPTWHPYGYLPFSAGPRNCIGQKFAIMEMKLVLSAVLRRYQLLPITRPHDVVFTVDFILRPKHPIYVKFRVRSEKS